MGESSSGQHVNATQGKTGMVSRGLAGWLKANRTSLTSTSY